MEADKIMKVLHKPVGSHRHFCRIGNDETYTIKMLRENAHSCKLKYVVYATTLDAGVLQAKKAAGIYNINMPAAFLLLQINQQIS